MAATVQDALTLRQAINQALGQNPQTTIAQAGIQDASSASKLAGTAMLPQLGRSGVSVPLGAERLESRIGLISSIDPRFLSRSRYAFHSSVFAEWLSVMYPVLGCSRRTVRKADIREQFWRPSVQVGSAWGVSPRDFVWSQPFRSPL